MALNLPGWLVPVLDLYRLPWPDVDEDAFHDLRQPLRNFGEDLQAVGEAIDSALRLLESGNPSATLGALTRHGEEIRSKFICPVRDTCDDLAGWPCDAAYEAIVAVKSGIIGTLTVEIFNDAADIVADGVTLGLDTAAAMAEAYGVREVLSETLVAAEGQVATTIRLAANQCLDDFVNRVVNPFISSVSSVVESSVDSYMARLLSQQALTTESALRVESGWAARLHLSPSQLDHCITSIVSSAAHLDQASQKLIGAIEEIFSRQAPSPQVSTLSSGLRMAVMGAMHTVEQDLVTALRTLIDQIVKHFVNLLQDYNRAIDEIDAQARLAASRKKVGPSPRVAVVPVVGVAAAVAATAAAAAAAPPTLGQFQSKVAQDAINDAHYWQGKGNPNVPQDYEQRYSGSASDYDNPDPQDENWCGDFVTKVLTQSGWTAPQGMGSPSSVKSWLDAASSNPPLPGFKIVTQPAPGDLVIYPNSSGIGQHIAIVTSYASPQGTFASVQGNFSDPNDSVYSIVPPDLAGQPGIPKGLVYDSSYMHVNSGPFDGAAPIFIQVQPQAAAS